jgi:hypothetical protein|tara:strand:- start:893 stop:1294 length:402 start_codon:yes stop_codon:yes gene_type:complete
MLVGKAIYSILEDSAAVGALIADRIYPNVATRRATFPFAIYQVTGDSPTDTKDGVSPLDENTILIMCFSKTYSEASDIADAVRTALDRVNGTYEGVVVQGIQYLSYNEDFDVKDADDGIYVKSLNFRVRLINN